MVLVSSKICKNITEVPVFPAPSFPPVNMSHYYGEFVNEWIRIINNC